MSKVSLSFEHPLRDKIKEHGITLKEFTDIFQEVTGIAVTTFFMKNLLLDINFDSEGKYQEGLYKTYNAITEENLIPPDLEVMERELQEMDLLLDDEVTMPNLH